jgi:hypothetical protein
MTTSTVPRTSLLQNFLSLPGVITDNLRTIIVGPDYAVRHDGFVGNYDQTLGTNAAWPGLLTGETVDLATPAVFIRNALVRYFTDGTGVPTGANGVQSGTTVNAIRHNAGATIWTGINRTPALNVDVKIGDYVYLANSGATVVLRTKVKNFGYLTNEPRILILEDNLPAGLQGGVFFNVTIAEIVPEIELPTADVTVTSTNVQADPAITWATTRTGSAYPVIAGSNFSGSTAYSKVYTNYRALRVANTTAVIEVTSETELNALFVGWQYPESELGFAMARALAPQLTPPVVRPVVLGAALPGLLITDWENTFSKLRRRRDWYEIAPLSTDSAVLAATQDLLESRTASDYVSHATVSLVRTTEAELFSGSLAVTLSGGDLVVTVSSGQPFLAAVPGDVITLNNGDFIVANTNSSQEVVVTTPATGATTLTAVTHPFSIPEQAADYGARASAFNTRTMSVSFPDQPTWNGVVVPGYLLSAAIAGLRGYTAPQQGLRGVLLETGWAVPQCAYEFLGELEILSNMGVFVVEAVEEAPTAAFVGYTNTTDQSEAIDAYEAMVANVDAVRRYFKDVLCAFEGRNKITALTLSQITTAASTALEYLRTNSVISPFGAIIVEGSVAPAYQDPNNAVRVVVPIAVSIAAELQRVDADITVTISVAG